MKKKKKKWPQYPYLKPEDLMKIQHEVNMLRNKKITAIARRLGKVGGINALRGDNHV